MASLRGQACAQKDGSDGKSGDHLSRDADQIVEVMNSTYTR